MAEQVDPKFPCAICPCPAWQHYTSIAGARSVCIICFFNKTTTGGSDYKFDPVHDFATDNLKYLEMKEKEKALWRGMPGITFGPIVLDEAKGD